MKPTKILDRSINAYTRSVFQMTKVIIKIGIIFREFHKKLLAIVTVLSKDREARNLVLPTIKILTETAEKYDELYDKFAREINEIDNETNAKIKELTKS